MRRATIPLLFVLAACADPGAADRQLATQVGRTESELVAAMGVPTRSTEVDGRRFLTYDYLGGTGSSSSITPSLGLGVGRTSWRGGSATGIGTGIGLGFGSYPAASDSCSTTFELRNGRVLGYQRQGPGCS
jgi:hypothetical protein